MNLESDYLRSLKIAAGSFVDCLRRISTNQALVARSVLTFEGKQSLRSAYAHKLALDVATPQGSDFPPFSGWMVLSLTSEANSPNAGQLIDRLRPLPNQTVIILQLRDHGEQMEWQSLVIRNRRVTTLESIEVVGSSFLHLSRQARFISSSASRRGHQGRGSRHAKLFSDSTARELANTTALIVGSSGTGSICAQTLCPYVGKEVLVDFDLVEPHNLDRMPGLAEEWIGKPKSHALAKMLNAHRSELAVTAHNRFWEGPLAEATASEASLICTCVDRPEARIVAAELSNRYLVPSLDIATGIEQAGRAAVRYSADVRFMLPKHGCLRCCGGIGEHELGKYSLRRPKDALLPRSANDWGSDSRLGSFLPINSVAVQFGVMSWLDWLAGNLKASIWHRLEWEPVQGLKTKSVLCMAKADCNTCQRSA